MASVTSMGDLLKEKTVDAQLISKVRLAVVSGSVAVISNGYTRVSSRASSLMLPVLLTICKKYSYKNAGPRFRL